MGEAAASSVGTTRPGASGRRRSRWADCLHPPRPHALPAYAPGAGWRLFCLDARPPRHAPPLRPPRCCRRSPPHATGMESGAAACGGGVPPSAVASPRRAVPGAPTVLPPHGRRFGACTADRHAIATCLPQGQVPTGALAATGVSWSPPYDRLASEGCQVRLVDPRHVPRAPDRGRAARRADPRVVLLAAAAATPTRGRWTALAADRAGAGAEARAAPRRGQRSHGADRQGHAPRHRAGGSAPRTRAPRSAPTAVRRARRRAHAPGRGRGSASPCAPDSHLWRGRTTPTRRARPGTGCVRRTSGGWHAPRFPCWSRSGGAAAARTTRSHATPGNGGPTWLGETGRPWRGAQSGRRAGCGARAAPPGAGGRVRSTVAVGWAWHPPHSRPGGKCRPGRRGRGCTEPRRRCGWRPRTCSGRGEALALTATAYKLARMVSALLQHGTAYVA